MIIFIKVERVQSGDDIYHHIRYVSDKSIFDENDILNLSNKGYIPFNTSYENFEIEEGFNYFYMDVEVYFNKYRGSSYYLNDRGLLYEFLLPYKREIEIKKLLC